VAVDDEEGAQQHVAREMDLLAQAVRATREDRDDQHLDDEGADREPPAAEVDLRQARQPPARQRHRQDAEQQGGADQHTRDIDAHLARLEKSIRPVHRTSVQTRSIRSRHCR
jgi:hypothetical protein